MTADHSLAVGGETPSPLASDVERTARDTDGFGLDAAGTLAWVRAHGSEIASAASAASVWEALAAAARVDVGGARMLEPHVDALQILAQAETVIDVNALRSGIAADADATWGVFAAEGRGVRVDAHETASGWILSGTKPWCSLASDLSHALVTAWTAPDERALFAVDLRQSAVRPHDGPWVSRGLAQVVSAPVDFDGAAARAVGGPGWYLRRPGFAWGGVGVAAVWWGAALPLVDAIVAAAGREGTDQLAEVYAGEADTASWAARCVLADAAARADGATKVAPGDIAHRARATVAASADSILSLADRALGPGPLTTDEAHARRVADLRIYLRQHHGARDLASLGRARSRS